MRLNIQTLHEWKKCPILFAKLCFAHNCFIFPLITMELNRQTPHKLRMCPTNSGKKVIAQDHIDSRIWLLEQTVFTFTPTSVNLHPPTSPTSQECALRSKRSGSQGSDYWKWFMMYKCIPFTPIIVIHHEQTSHELSMCHIDVMIKRSKVKDHDW